MTSPPHIMIVAGEASGDLHGANFVRRLRARVPEISVCGMGGVEMAAAGVELLVDISNLAVMGLAEVLSHLSEIRSAMRVLHRRLRERPPDLLVLIDYPGFNLMMAARAKKQQVPVFYYISPKVWAWGGGRVEKIKRLVDRMAVILPFEEEFYRERGVAVRFVGNPLLDSVENRLGREEFLRRHGVEPDCTVIGILPGSRRMEVASLLPAFLAAAESLAGRRKTVFLVPLASTLSRADLDRNGLAGCQLDYRVIGTDRYELMAACDAVMAASGTVTLELAILNVPMVVAYRVSWLTYIIGRLLVKVKHFSLVNLVAGREVVPELLQGDVTPQRLADEVEWLLDAGRASSMRQQLAEVVNRLGEPGAAGRAVEVALELIDWQEGESEA